MMLIYNYKLLLFKDVITVFWAPLETLSVDHFVGQVFTVFDDLLILVAELFLLIK